jgi:hypothetical protein
MSFRTEPAIIVECDGEGCFEEWVALVGQDEHDALISSGWATGENGKHYCDACIGEPVP